MGGNSGRRAKKSVQQRELEVAQDLLARAFKVTQEQATAFKQPEVQATAHHEAGHVVAAMHYELKFTYVTIIPDEQQESLGHVHFRGLGDSVFKRFENSRPTDRMQMDIERHVITMLTAGAAEARFRGRRNYRGARKDREDAAELVKSGRAGADLVLLKKYLDYTQEVAMCFVADNRNWNNIRKVAAALLAHPRHRLSQPEVRAVLHGRPIIVSKTRRTTTPPL